MITLYCVHIYVYTIHVIIYVIFIMFKIMSSIVKRYELSRTVGGLGKCRIIIITTIIFIFCKENFEKKKQLQIISKKRLIKRQKMCALFLL